MGQTCDHGQRELIISKKIAQLLDLEPAAVLLALTMPLNQASNIFTHLYHIPVVSERDRETEYYSRRAESADSVPFSFDRKASDRAYSEAEVQPSRSAPTNIMDVFGAAERPLKGSGSKVSLVHGHKYHLNYGFGTVDVSEARERGFFSSLHSFPAPIIIPTNSKDSSWVTSVLGEFYVFEALKNNLSGFALENWTSKLRGKIPKFQAFNERSRAAFTYSDTKGKLTEVLYGTQVRKQWGPKWPTYHLDVKTTEGPSTRFVLTEDQARTASELTVSNPEVVPKDIYAIVKVENLQSSDRSLRIFPDPHRLIYDRKLQVTSSTVVEIVS
ncbi:hypothetical protein BXZ70DRAFT_911757 [Cristinia sonorae]|uniref:Uncharacterized protein n=1 Tax=Cristinia sonorae TaxID=1940300 RepID=A0A8K0UXH4_9AGAR|nr:hypothetical protein BXZ70DRAFT_911757 [Cristinia sonorae]